MTDQDHSSTASLIDEVKPASGREPEAGIPPKKRAGDPTSAVVKMLPALARSLQWHNQQEASKLLGEAADKIEERYPAVAKSIRRQIPSRAQPTRLVARPDHLVALRNPRHGLDEVVVEESVALACRRILDEHARREDLAAFSLEPRHKVLLSGPPGNGKTMLAEALAKELDAPFLVMKPSGVMDSFLGKTERNLAEVMDYAATGPCVLFLDEFDGVGKQRGGNHDVGEMHRVANQLLLSMDQLPSHVVLIAATNLEHILDQAVRRRFDFHLEIRKPTVELRQELASRELDPARTPGHDLRVLVPKVATIASESLHAVVDLCRDLRRQVALYGKAELPTTL